MVNPAVRTAKGVGKKVGGTSWSELAIVHRVNGIAKDKPTNSHDNRFGNPWRILQKIEGDRYRCWRVGGFGIGTEMDSITTINFKEGTYGEMQNQELLIFVRRYTMSTIQLDRALRFMFATNFLRTSWLAAAIEIIA
jgi:hypothetical protein